MQIKRQGNQFLFIKKALQEVEASGLQLNFNAS